MADLERFISDVLVEKIAIEKSQESSMKEKQCLDNEKDNLEFDEKLFVYFMQSYGRLEKLKEEYHKVRTWLYVYTNSFLARLYIRSSHTVHP